MQFDDTTPRGLFTGTQDTGRVADASSPVPSSGSNMGIADLMSGVGLMLSATAAGAQGDFGVVQRAMAMKASEEERKKLDQIRARQLEMQERRMKFEEAKGILDFADKYEIPDQVMTKALKEMFDTSPTMAASYGDPLDFKLTRRGKDRVIESSNFYEEGELEDPGKRGKFLPSGWYTVQQESPKEGTPGRTLKVMPLKDEGGVGIEKFTPESYRKYYKTRNQSDLELREEAGIKDTPSVLSAARLITGRSVKTLKDLTPTEVRNTLFYDNSTPQTKEQLNAYLQKNPQGNISEVYSDAMSAADKRKVENQVKIVVSSAGAATEAREKAKLKVRSSPEFIEAETKLVAARESAQRMNARMGPEQERRFTQYQGIERNLDVIAENYDPGYVGRLPAAIGFQTQLDSAFNDALKSANKSEYKGGEIIGKLNAYLGTLPPAQAKLYRALADNADRILRARSGAAINETEAERLKGVVPNASDMPAVFQAKFEDFSLDIKNEQVNMMKAITKAPGELATEVGKPSSRQLGAKPKPKILGIERIR